MKSKYIIPLALILFIILLNKSSIYSYIDDLKNGTSIDTYRNNIPLNNESYENIHNDIYVNDTQLQQILIDKHFNKLSDGPSRQLSQCIYTKYTKATIDEILKININHISNLVLSRINYTSKFKFALIEYNSVQIFTDIHGNKRYIIDILVEEPCHLFGTRLQIDVIAYIVNAKNGPPQLFQNTYPGYPTHEQLIPLPTDVIVTGKDVLSTNSIKINSPDNIYGLYLNYVKIVNSDLTLNATDKMNYSKILGVNKSSIESSAYTDKSTPYIESAIERNKWTTLSSQPKNQMQYPCTTVPQVWNNLGIYPEKIPTSKCPGLNWGTMQQPLVANWWYSTIGVPRNSGEYYWMFDISSGISSNSANYNI